MKEKNILRILSQSHAMEILSSLNKKQMRFLDLKDICKSSRTRSARLKEMENRGLIKAVPKIMGRRAYTFYETTSLGKQALKLGEKLILLESEEQKAIV